MPTWNPWHGCNRISAGCLNCYVYRSDARYDRDSSLIMKTGNFNLPLKSNRAGEYKISSGEIVYTCFTSDFFLPEADEWRRDIWQIIHRRSDLHFLIITKRIDRFHVSLPDDWGDGYDNVVICSTAENQDRADYRLPILLNLPIKHMMIICEPLLEAVDLTPYLKPTVEQVVVGGESGNEARICHFEWVLAIREQCRQAGVAFHFKQTGALFQKDGKVYRIPRKLQHSQARRACIDLGNRGKCLRDN